MDKKFTINFCRGMMCFGCIFAVAVLLLSGIVQGQPHYLFCLVGIPIFFAIATLIGEVFVRVLFRLLKK